MRWIAPTEKDATTTTLEKGLWDAADQFRANSGLKAQEYSGPILGLIFLRFAEARFATLRAKLQSAGASSRRGSRVDEPAAYHAKGVLYLAPAARYDHLLTLPEAADVGAQVNEAMREIETHNRQLSGVLPKTYNLFTGTLLKELLKKVSEIPVSVDFDAFGRIYEYFLSTVREGRLDLHLAHHVGHARHDLFAGKYRGPVAHEIRHAAPIARALEQRRADEGHGLGIVEL